MVSLQLGYRSALGGIGTRIGLRQAERAYLAADGEHGQVLRLLGFGAVGHDRVTAQSVMGGYDVAGGSALLAQLLDTDSGSQGVRPGAAVFLGNTDAHDAQVEQLIDVRLGILAGSVRLRCDGLDFGLRESSHHLAKQLVFTAQIEIHTLISFCHLPLKCFSLFSRKAVMPSF